MKRVKMIIADCRENREDMSLPEFKYCINAIYHHLTKATEYEDGSLMSRHHLNIADKICDAVSECFFDRNDNLVRWFKGEPCQFHHPVTRNDIEVKVRDDYEAIYYFLCYCEKLNLYKEIDDESLAYLAYILCEPVED